MGFLEFVGLFDFVEFVRFLSLPCDFCLPHGIAKDPFHWGAFLPALWDPKAIPLGPALFNSEGQRNVLIQGSSGRFIRLRRMVPGYNCPVEQGTLRVFNCVKCPKGYLSGATIYRRHSQGL